MEERLIETHEVYTRIAPILIYGEKEYSVGDLLRDGNHLERILEIDLDKEIFVTINEHDGVVTKREYKIHHPIAVLELGRFTSSKITPEDYVNFNLYKEFFYNNILDSYETFEQGSGI